MKILWKAIHLFIWGLYAEYYKKKFNKKIIKRLKKNRFLSDKNIVSRANKAYLLFRKFNELEANFLCETDFAE